MIGGDVPFYLKFSAEVTHPLQKRRVDLSCKRLMLLVLGIDNVWCRVLSDPRHHPPPTQNWRTLQLGFSTTAEMQSLKCKHHMLPLLESNKMCVGFSFYFRGMDLAESRLRLHAVYFFAVSSGDKWCQFHLFHQWLRFYLPNALAALDRL